jgi:hypothetical protein
MRRMLAKGRRDVCYREFWTAPLYGGYWPTAALKSDRPIRSFKAGGRDSTAGAKTRPPIRDPARFTTTHQSAPAVQG